MTLEIGDRRVGPGETPYVIAEIGVNHDGDPDRALALIDAASAAGADAVKFQFFETDRLMSAASRLAAYQRDAGETDPFAMLRRLELGLDELGACVDRAHARGVHAIVSVFSAELVGGASRLAWDAWKTASPDLVNRPLLDRLASDGRPIVVSTGAAEPGEIERTRAHLDGAAPRLAFLHCVSAYPAAPADAHLLATRDVARLVAPCPVGYSDHTAGEETGGVAVAKAGATILEKHFTDDAARPGPDHRASLEPGAFARYARLAREPSGGPFDDRLLGEPSKRVLDVERDVREVSRQSVVCRRPIGAGEAIGRDDLTTKRPGTGVSAWDLPDVVGRRAARAIEADTPLTWDDLS